MAAVLAADVAGYSRLMGADEEATIAALGRARAVFREHVASHHGRVVDTAGDSVLSIFESVIEAVRAALAVQETLAARNADVPEDRRMQFRIGVHFGDIVEQEDGTIYGDGVNIAARLESLAEPGGLTVSGTVHEHIEGKLGIGLADLGEQEVKNIARPVRAWRVAAEGEPRPSVRRSMNAKRQLRFVAASVLLAGICVAVWQSGLLGTSESPNDPTLAMPAGPSIAVLPLANLSGDPTQDYFVEGLTADITNALTAFDLKVMAAGSAAVYADRQDDPAGVAAELGVRYLIKGSVRRLGNSLRLTVQLVNGEDGANLWGQSFDADLSGTELFTTMDQAVGAVVAQIASDFGAINRYRLVGLADQAPETLSAYECSLGYLQYQVTLSPDDFTYTKNCLEAALESDPGYTIGWAILAVLYGNDYQFGFGTVPDARERAFEAANRAMAIDPSNPRAIDALAWAHFVNRNQSEFLKLAEQAISLNSNDAMLIGSWGPHMIWAGEEERGKELLDKALQLNPHYPPWWNLGYSDYHVSRGEYADALAYAEKCLAIDSDNPGGLISYIGILGQLGRSEEASASIARLQEVWPDIAASIDGFLMNYYFDPEKIHPYLDGMRRAGFNPAPTTQ